MPCFEHDGYHQADPVPAGTEVLLEGAPASRNAAVVIYLWRPSEGRCAEHDAPVTPSIAFTHKATLASEILWFVCHNVCRQAADGTRETLYNYAASGADLVGVRADRTPVCP